MLKQCSAGLILLAAVTSSFAQSNTDWTSFYPTTGSATTEPKVVRPDTFGGNVVASATQVGSEQHLMVQNFDPDGNVVWTTSFDAPGLTASRPIDMQVDESGAVIITGFVQSLETFESMWLTLKIAANGEILWSRMQFQGESRALEIGAGGHAFISGYRENGSDLDIVTQKISSNGGIVWTKSCSGAAGISDLGTTMGMDGLGNLYVGGYSQGSSTGVNLTQRLIKYNQNGARLWTKTLGLANLDVVPIEIIGKPGGGCYVASNAVFEYGMVTSHDSDGNQMWRRTIDLSSREDAIVDMVLKGIENITVVSNVQSATSSDILTRRFDSSGNVLWTKKYAVVGDWDEKASSIGVTSDGTVYVAGSSQLDNDSQSLVLKYNTSGVRLWDSFYASPEGYAANVDLAIDGQKAVVLGAFQATPARQALMLSRIQ
ncbi:MAG: hypothetical protein ACAH95_03685 [Fimbriimonas sp.]